MFFRVDFKLILNYWQKDYESCWLISRSTWSLVLLILFKRKRDNRNRIKLLVPAYYCRKPIDILGRLDVDIAFYEINEYLAPERDSFQKKLIDVHPDIIIFVHYWGSSDELNEFKTILIDFPDIWIIEDAAQVFLPTKQIGNIGHFVLFSPYKFLSIPSGAVLSVTKRGMEFGLDNETFIYLLSEAQERCFQCIETSGTQITNHLRWFVKQVLSWTKISLNYNIEFLETSHGSDKIEKPEIGWVVKKMFFAEVKQISKFKEIRIQNLKMIEEVASDDKYNSLIKQDFIKKVAKNVNDYENIPSTFPLVFSNPSSSKIYFRKFVDEGIHVNYWPDLPLEVLKNKNQYKNTYKMQKSTIHLPIHQSLKMSGIFLDSVFSRVLKD